MTTLISTIVLVMLITWLFPKTFFPSMFKGLFNRHSANVLVGILRFLGRLLSGILQLLLGLFDLIFSLFALPFRSKKKAVQGGGLHDDKFLGYWKSRKLLSKRHKGVCVDGVRKLNLDTSFKHILVTGGTGSGKSSGYILPTILRCPHSMVITDPSGELFLESSGALKKKGFKVKVIDLGNPSQSLFFNPLARAKDHTALKKVIEVLVQNAYPQSTPDAQFWNMGAISILFCLAKMLRNLSIKYQNMANLLFLVNSFGSDGSALNDFVSENADPQTFLEWKSILANDTKVLQSMLATAKIALDKVSDPAIASLTSKDTVGFEDLRKQPTALFIRVPEHELQYYSFLTCILLTQLFAYMMETGRSKKEQPVFFILDEFPHIGRIPQFETLISVVRKRLISLSLIVQEPSQLVHVYGKAASQTIYNGGCTTRIFLPGMGIDTAAELERMLGRANFEYTDLKGERREGVRSLLTSSEIRTMDSGHALLFHANLPGKLLKVRPYYKQFALRKLSRIPSVIIDQHRLTTPEYVSLDPTPTMPEPGTENTTPNDSPCTPGA